jgi:type II secretory pathway pseudopilin PulG
LLIAIVLSTILAAPAAIPLPDAPATWRPAIEKAQEAGRAFQKALQARLAEAMSQGGPPAAIDACATDAARIAAEASAAAGVKMGRASDRLRSAVNAPPDWARDPLEGAAGKKGADVGPLAVDLGGKVGVLLPIVIGSACLGCHGPSATLQPKVKEALAARYPADRAVGYAVGDFRGFLWVEAAK